MGRASRAEVATTAMHRSNFVVLSQLHGLMQLSHSGLRSSSKVQRDQTLRERRGKLVSLGSRSKPCYTVGHVLVAVGVDYGHAGAAVAVDYDHAAPAVDHVAAAPADVDAGTVAVGHEFVVLAVDHDGVAAVDVAAAAAAAAVVALEPTVGVEGVEHLLWIRS